MSGDTGKELGMLDGRVGACVDRESTGPTGSLGGFDAEGPTMSAPAPLANTRKIGRYTIQDYVARGGMGVVYRAFDPTLQRTVALKVIGAGKSDSRPDDATARQMLLAEAQTLAKISHPNVITVFDVGIVDEEVFVAMEYVRGQTLREWAVYVEPTQAEIMRAYLTAGRGLVAVHDAGLSHRDFKPQNVLRGENGRVHLVDFGLARPNVTANSSPQVFFRAAPQVSYQDGVNLANLSGTPMYMSPEQLRGDPLDELTDQFSFCVSLWEALYGRRPFAGTIMSELLRAILAGDIRKAPDRTEVPRALRHILLRGLSAKPAHRHNDMRTLLTKLTPFARPGSGPRRHKA